MAMQLTLQPASAKKDELGTPIGLHYYDLSLSKCYSTNLRGISYNRHIFGLIIVIIMRRQLEGHITHCAPSVPVESLQLDII